MAYGWGKPDEIIQGLALAETTPGPLIMVVQFVAFLGACRSPGSLDPWMAGNPRRPDHHLGHLACPASCSCWSAPRSVELVARQPASCGAGSPHRDHGGRWSRYHGESRALLRGAHLLCSHHRTALGPDHVVIPDVATTAWLAVLISALWPAC